MKIQCPYCRAEMEILPEHLGHRADCPSCNVEMQIPVLQAKFIDPPQPEPVSIKMIASGVVRGLFIFWGIVFAIAIVLSIILFTYEKKHTEEFIRKTNQEVTKAKRIEMEIEAKKEQEAVKIMKLDIAVENADKNRAAVEKQAAEDAGYMERLQELASRDARSNEAKAEAATLIKNLTSRYGDLGISINQTTGKIIGMDEAQKRFFERTKQIRMAAVKRQIDALKAKSDYQLKKAMVE